MKRSSEIDRAVRQVLGEEDEFLFTQGVIQYYKPGKTKYAKKRRKRRAKNKNRRSG